MPTSAGRQRISDWPAVLAACGAAVAAATLLERLGSDAFETILGVGQPVVGTLAVTASGCLGLIVVKRRSWIGSVDGGGWARALVIGGLLPIPVIVVDLLGGFGPAINSPAPASLLFYPVVALLAEFSFHIAPLALAGLLASLWKPAEGGLERLGLFGAVSIEAVFQMLWGAGQSPAWANTYVGFHLLVFNLVAVHFLRRYGFMRVYLYRLAYYAIWHILWGHLRLSILFAA